MMNQIFIAGRLTKASEIGHTESGVAYTRFTIANNKSYKKGDEWKEKTTFIDVIVFKELLLEKGDLVVVRGELQQRNYKDKDGNNRKSYSILAREVLLVTGKSDVKEEEVSEDIEF